MDGGYKNPRMNLRKEIFWPDNIVKVIYCSLILVHSDPILQLFKKYNVRKKFDLLSEDSDNNDFFMLEAILKAGYRPRVIIVEYNSNFELTEARSVMPPRKGEAWQRWDSSRYHGMSLLAAQYLLNRFSYSMVWANKGSHAQLSS